MEPKKLNEENTTRDISMVEVGYTKSGLIYIQINYEDKTFQPYFRNLFKQKYEIV